MTLRVTEPRPSSSRDPRQQKLLEQLSRQVPGPGAVILWPSATAPEGWISLGGAAISRLTYSHLFALFGTTFGVGDGSTTFNVPNWNGSAPSGGIYIMKV